MNLLSRSGRIEAREAVWFRRSQLVVSGRNLLVKVDGLLLHAVRHLARRNMAFQPLFNWPFQEKGDVRARKRRWPCRRHATGTALVGESRVVVPIGNHNL